MTSDGDKNFSKLQAFLVSKNCDSPSHQPDTQRRNDANALGVRDDSKKNLSRALLRLLQSNLIY
jgi:hypothetical protein